MLDLAKAMGANTATVKDMNEITGAGNPFLPHTMAEQTGHAILVNQEQTKAIMPGRQSDGPEGV